MIYLYLKEMSLIWGHIMVQCKLIDWILFLIVKWIFWWYQASSLILKCVNNDDMISFVWFLFAESKCPKIYVGSRDTEYCKLVIELWD